MILKLKFPKSTSFSAFVLIVFVLILFSNFIVYAAKPVTVTVIDPNYNNMARIRLDITGYTPTDGTVIAVIKSTTGAVVLETELHVRPLNDFAWGAELLFTRTSSSNYQAIVYKENGSMLGSTNFSLTSSSIAPPTPIKTYYNTNVYLQVEDSSSSGYITVYPELTWGSGSSLATDDVEIYVDGNYKRNVSSNEWSLGIWAGSGTHTIKAVVPELTDTNNDSIIYRPTSDTLSYYVNPSGPPTPIKTYRDTYLDLQVEDSSSSGYITVYPELTWGSGSSLATDDVEIYVDGNYKRNVSSNEWSLGIWAGSGTHTIKAVVPELTDFDDESIIYRPTSDTDSHTARSSGSDFPIGIVVLVLLAAVGVGVGIAISKRRKSMPVKTPSSSRIPTTGGNITQFWVCPRCGNDTQNYQGRQYCANCRTYL